MEEIAIIGATLSGNKGAAAMLQSVLDNLPPLLENAHFSVLSVYPDEDQQLNEDEQVEIVPARPVALVLAVPLAALWAVFRRLHLPTGPLRRSPVIAALERSDLLIDLGGISFTDGRVIELVYNVVCILPALLMGKRVVKYSQAMGPFETALNRWAARLLLPRVALNIARGERTLGYLRSIGLKNIALCADAAFAMKERETRETEEALAALNRFGGRKIIGISASSVVRTYAWRHGVGYCRVLADFVDQATTQGYGVWLIAHAVKKSGKGGRTDDVSTCRAIYELLGGKAYCQLVTEDYSPQTLRAIIGECDYLIASRFHAMVSALTRGIPLSSPVGATSTPRFWRCSGWRSGR